MAQIAIRMPKMSMTMTEGEVSEWFVEIGDPVAQGDVVCEVLTDKVDMEVESPASGTISSIVVESGSVDVGTPIAYIEGDDSGGFGDLLDSVGAPQELPTAAPDAARDSRVAGSDDAAASNTASNAPVAAVPRARSLAAASGIDLAGLAGSGPDGLVLMADVEQVVAPRTDGAAAPAAAKTPSPGHPSTKRAALVRARVAAKMTQSASVPQFTVWRDLLVDEANSRRDGVSWTTVLLIAYAAALREVPALLCRWDGSAAVETGPPGVGLAVDTPHGLLAPVLAEPDRDSPVELDQRVRALVTTAQTGRVDAAYLRDGNATLSNLGGLDVDRFQALVTPPQASVLSVGSIRPRPVAVAGGVGTALTVSVGLTVDHRVADGADAARLLVALAQRVTGWGSPPAQTLERS